MPDASAIKSPDYLFECQVCNQLRLSDTYLCVCLDLDHKYARIPCDARLPQAIVNEIEATIMHRAPVQTVTVWRTYRPLIENAARIQSWREDIAAAERYVTEQLDQVTPGLNAAMAAGDIEGFEMLWRTNEALLLLHPSLQTYQDFRAHYREALEAAAALRHAFEEENPLAVLYVWQQHRKVWPIVATLAPREARRAQATLRYLSSTGGARLKRALDERDDWAIVEAAALCQALDLKLPALTDDERKRLADAQQHVTAYVALREALHRGDTQAAFQIAAANASPGFNGLLDAAERKALADATARASGRKVASLKADADPRLIQAVTYQAARDGHRPTRDQQRLLQDATARRAVSEYLVSAAQRGPEALGLALFGLSEADIALLGPDLRARGQSAGEQAEQRRLLSYFVAIGDRDRVRELSPALPPDDVTPEAQALRSRIAALLRDRS